MSFIRNDAVFSPGLVQLTLEQYSYASRRQLNQHDGSRHAEALQCALKAALLLETANSSRGTFGARLR